MGVGAGVLYGAPGGAAVGDRLVVGKESGAAGWIRGRGYPAGRHAFGRAYWVSSRGARRPGRGQDGPGLSAAGNLST